jgi:hypothetical protein
MSSSSNSSTSPSSKTEEGSDNKNRFIVGSMWSGEEEELLVVGSSSYSPVPIQTLISGQLLQRQGIFNNLHKVCRNEYTTLSFQCTSDPRQAAKAIRLCSFFVQFQRDRIDNVAKVVKCNLEHSCIQSLSSSRENIRKRNPSMKVLKQTGNPILTKFAHVKNSKRSEGVTVKNFVETITNIDPHLKLKVRQVQR